MGPIALPTSKRGQSLFYDDHQAISDALYDIENQQFGDYSSPKEKKSRHTKLTIVVVMLLTYVGLYFAYEPLQKTLPEEVSSFSKKAFATFFTTTESTTDFENETEAVAPVTKTTEIFEILPDLAPPLGSYEYSTLLFNVSSFAEDPKISADFETPDIFNFTDVLLTLNFTTEGLQAPIILDVYVDEFPIWRTSTPNPLGLSANSFTTKNVTDYLNLFKLDRTINVVIVDGEVSGGLTVSLEATFYNSTSSSSATLPGSFGSATDLFVASKPADIIFPISNDGISYQLPAQKMKITIPKLPKNVTIARLELFASTSEDEISYYTNAIGKALTDPEVGPLRAINVFVDSNFIAGISPNPSLLRADQLGKELSTAKAWSPLAASGAFDALSYEIDLTSVLPLLWAGDVKLEIEVISLIKSSTMAVPFAAGPVPLPGSDLATDINRWDLTGNLLAWQSPFVSYAKGELVTADSLINGTGVLIGVPGGFYENQIVRASVDSGLISVLNFTLFDNSTLSLKSTLNSTSGAFSLKQSTKGAVAKDSLTLISTSEFGFVVENNTLPIEAGLFKKPAPISPDAVFSYNKSTAFPLVLKETFASTPIWGKPINGSLEVKLGYGYETRLNDTIQVSFNSRQNATVDDLSVTTESTVLISLPGEPVPFSRDVTAVDGVITKDSSVLSEVIDSFQFDDFDFFDVMFTEVDLESLLDYNEIQIVDESA